MSMVGLIDAPQVELQLPTAMTAEQSFRQNYDENACPIIFVPLWAVIIGCKCDEVGDTATEVISRDFCVIFTITQWLFA